MKRKLQTKHRNVIKIENHIAFMTIKIIILMATDDDDDKASFDS